MRISAIPPHAGLKSIVNELRSASERSEEREILRFRLLLIGEKQAGQKAFSPPECLPVGEFHTDAKGRRVAAKYVVVAQRLPETDEENFLVNVGRYRAYTARATAAMPSRFRSWKLTPKDKCSRFLRFFYEHWYLNPERRPGLPGIVFSDDPFGDAADLIEEDVFGSKISRARSGTVPTPAVTSSKKEQPAAIESKAIAALVLNPGASIVEIAKIVGCSRPHLYKCNKFLQARQAAKDAAKDAARGEIPRGSKDREGYIEAVAKTATTPPFATDPATEVSPLEIKCDISCDTRG